MVIRIKIVTGYALLLINLALLGWLWVSFGNAGLGMYAIAGAVQLWIWAAMPQDTPEKRKRRETAFVRADGQIFCNGKRIGLREARKRGLKLEYEEEPKKKQPNFWNGR